VQSLGLKADLLPRILESTEAAGSLTEAASQECGLETGTPVAVGGGDQAMAALGLGMIHEGEVACSIGTGGQVVAVGSKTIEEPKRRVHVLCHVKKDVSLVMGAVLAAGLSLRWFRDNLGDTEVAEAERTGRSPYELFSELAERVVPGAEGLIFLPYLSGERTPHMDASARGCFIGLTLSHTKAHMVRALLEGVAFAMKDSLSLVREFGVPVESLVLSGGGAKSAVWRRIQADVYNLPARVVERDEHSAYGAALIAGVACGQYTNIDEAACIARSTRGDAGAVIVPNKEDAAVYQKYYETFRSLYPSLRQAFQELSSGPG
jgi:xylulokinase